jgi:hypothetical protein
VRSGHAANSATKTNHSSCAVEANGWRITAGSSAAPAVLAAPRADCCVHRLVRGRLARVGWDPDEQEQSYRVRSHHAGHGPFDGTPGRAEPRRPDRSDRGRNRVDAGRGIFGDSQPRMTACTGMLCSCEIDVIARRTGAQARRKDALPPGQANRSDRAAGPSGQRLPLGAANEGRTLSRSLLTTSRRG